MTNDKPTTIAEYIDAAPEEAQEKLRELQTLLKEVAPNASEAIKWGNPVFEEKRILFAFAAYKDHINFMPTPSALEPFKELLADYKTGRGSMQLPYAEPLPKDLIRKIATFRVKNVAENDARWM
jgi:uncharacterized protein YdhG (YjbR/CyaY superfamily)